MLFISHDIESVQAVCERVVVLYLGCELESGPIDEVLAHPAHPYTQALLSARLALDPAEQSERIHLEGEIPSPLAAPPGCPFATRCHKAIDACSSELPAFRDLRASTVHRPDTGTRMTEEAIWRARCIRIESDPA